MALARPAAMSSILRTVAYSPAVLLFPRVESRLWTSLPILSTAVSIPAISISVPEILSDIWDSVLRAVPKKKTSHMKKRHRQLAGKALKDVNAVNTCPGCGQPKKAHTLCPSCVDEIRESWKQAAKQASN